MRAAEFGLFGSLHSLRQPITPAQAAAVGRRAWLARVDQATRARA